MVADLSASRINPVLRRSLTMWSETAIASVDFNAKTVDVIEPSVGVRDGTFAAQAVPAADRAAMKDRFFADVLPLEKVAVADANAIACEHDDFLAAVRTRQQPLVSAAAVEVAARVLESLEITRFGKTAGSPAAGTIPLYPRRKIA
jgi:hypothetical protein